jgi:hypothetical protein
MTRKVYIVTDAAGNVHERVAHKRTLTHAVVYTLNYQFAMSEAAEEDQDDANVYDVDWWMQQGSGRAWAEGAVARSIERYGKYGSRAEAIAAGCKRRIDDVLALAVDGHYAKWHCRGWCNGYKRALVLASCRRQRRYTNVVILEATIKR